MVFVLHCLGQIFTTLSCIINFVILCECNVISHKRLGIAESRVLIYLKLLQCLRTSVCRKILAGNCEDPRWVSSRRSLCVFRTSQGMGKRRTLWSLSLFYTLTIRYKNKTNIISRGARDYEDARGVARSNGKSNSRREVNLPETLWVLWPTTPIVPNYRNADGNARARWLKFKSAWQGEAFGKPWSPSIRSTARRNATYIAHYLCLFFPNNPSRFRTAMLSYIFSRFSFCCE